MNLSLTIVWMLVAYVLFVQHGYNSGAFLGFNLALLLILVFRGKSSPIPWIFIGLFIFGLNQYDATFSNGYRIFLDTLDPAWALWIDPDQYDFKDIFRQCLQFLYKLTGLYHLLNGQITWAIWGYTVPELLLLIVCGFWIVGLLVAIRHSDETSAFFSRSADKNIARYTSSGTGSVVFYWILQWVPRVSAPISHRGWRAAIRVGLMPIAYLLAGYLWYLSMLVGGMALLLAGIFWILGVDIQKLTGTKIQA